MCQWMGSRGPSDRKSVRNNKHDITATAAPESTYSSSTCAKKATSSKWMTAAGKSSRQLTLAAKNWTVRLPRTPKWTANNRCAQTKRTMHVQGLQYNRVLSLKNKIMEGTRIRYSSDEFPSCTWRQNRGHRCNTRVGILILATPR